MHRLLRLSIPSFVFSFICGFPLYSQSSNSFTFQFSYTGDLLHNITGGIKQKTAYAGLANFMVGFNTQAAHAWQGGTFFINLANMHGNEPSKDLVSDFQGLTNIEAGDHTMLYELWYRQTVSAYSITIGLQDMNMTFMTNDIACSFINSSFAIQPTLTKNIPAPIYPLTALGIMFNWSVTPSIDCKMALYDGTPESFIQNPFNLKWGLNKRNGWLFISEFDKTGSLLQDMAGSYKIGLYFHQSGNIQLSTQTDYGIYAIINQQLIKTRTSSISFFSQIGTAPKTTNKNPYFLSLGITSKGFMHNRPNDEIGIGCAHAKLRYTNVKNETALETYYAMHLNKIFYIKPDFQYIIHPAGEDQHLANALVGIVRFGIYL